MRRDIRSLALRALLSCLLALPVGVCAQQAPSDEELKALEQQIEKKETEQAEAKKRAEAKKKAETEARSREEAAKAAELEKKKQEEAAAKQAAEERRKQEEEKRKAEETQNNADIKKSRESGTPIQGEWYSTDDQGNILFVDAKNGKVRGIYRNILYSGEIEGDFHNNTLTGYWSQTISRQSCADKRNGNQYWGRLVFTFDAAFKEFTGKWGYCDAEASQPWNGLRVK